MMHRSINPDPGLARQPTALALAMLPMILFATLPSLAMAGDRQAPTARDRMAGGASSATDPSASLHGTLISGSSDSLPWLVTMQAFVVAATCSGDECIFANGFERPCPAFLFRNGFESGRLMQEGSSSAPIEYRSRGGFTIKIDLHTITITDPWGTNTVEHWGDPHENLNGKHIKDWGGAAGWDGQRRTVLLSDATKITMHSAGAQGVTLLTSIYDGEQSVHLDNTGNLILHHGFDATETQARDAAEYDGETALFHTDAGTGIATYTNIGIEDVNFESTTIHVPLGTTGGCANPNQVNDLFDDPRLGHT